MSNAELLLKEIEGLPAHCMGEVLDFVGYLKHKASPAEQKEIRGKKPPLPKQQKPFGNSAKMLPLLLIVFLRSVTQKRNVRKRSTANNDLCS
jgi:hypothetical protein